MKEAPLRLAYLFDQRLPCTATDTEQVLNTLAALSRADVDVTLTLPKDWLRADVDGEGLKSYYQVECPPLKVKRLRSLSPGPRWLVKPAHALRAAFFARLSLRDYDVFYTRNAPAMVCALLFSLPVVYETYRPWPIQIKALRPLFKWAMNHSAFVGGVFHSDFARQTYIDLGVSADTLEVVHNGFDPSRFSEDPGTETARIQCGLTVDGEEGGKPIEGLVIAYTGRVNLNKGLGIVLELAPLHPEVTFLIVGSEGEGEVERGAAELSNVIIKPWATYDQLPHYLFAADILMVPPSQGPLAKVGNTVLPMKLFQYLAAGRTIFAPAAPDTAELLQHGQNAYLVPPDDLKAASVGIEELKTTPKLRSELAQGAKSTSESLSWDSRAQKILGFLARRGIKETTTSVSEISS